MQKGIAYKLFLVSAYILAFSMSLSIALDNVGIGIGILAFLISVIHWKDFLRILSKGKFFLYVLIPELMSCLLNGTKNILKFSDINQHLIVYYVSYMVSENRRLLEKVINVFSLSVLLLCFSVFFEALTGQNIKHVNLHTLTLAQHLYRAKGFLTHPLTTAGVLYLSMVLLLFSYFYFGKRKVYLIILPLVVVSILFTESRSYWLGLFLFFFLMLVLLLRKRLKTVLVVTGVSLALIVSIISFSSSLSARMTSIVNVQNNPSNVIRLLIWQSHLRAFLYDYSWEEKLFGVCERNKEFGWRELDNSCRFLSEYNNIPPDKLKSWVHGMEAHNIYIKFLTKYGIVGLLGFLLFWGYIFKQNLRLLSTNFEVASTFIAGYAGFLLAGFFENNFTDAEVQILLYFILGINMFLVNLFTGNKDTDPS